MSNRILEDQIFDLILQERYNFLSYRQIGEFFWDFKDIVGALQAKNDPLTFKMSRNYLIDQLMGLYVLSGVTNKNRKWFSSYLKRMD